MEQEGGERHPADKQQAPNLAARISHARLRSVLRARREKRQVCVFHSDQIRIHGIIKHSQYLSGANTSKDIK